MESEPLLVQIMTCCLFNINPVSKPMLVDWTHGNTFYWYIYKQHFIKEKMNWNTQGVWKSSTLNAARWSRNFEMNEWMKEIFWAIYFALKPKKIFRHAGNMLSATLQLLCLPCQLKGNQLKICWQHFNVFLEWKFVCVDSNFNEVYSYWQ